MENRALCGKRINLRPKPLRSVCSATDVYSPDENRIRLVDKSTDEEENRDNIYLRVFHVLVFNRIPER